MIDQWTKEKFYEGTECKKDLMERLVELNTNFYRIYAVEVMNLCLWVKRFAEGMIDGEVGGDKEG